MIVAFDVWLLGFFSAWRSAAGDLLFSAITWTGSLWLLLPFSLLIGVFRQQALVPLSILTAAVASHSLKPPPRARQTQSPCYARVFARRSHAKSR